MNAEKRHLTITMLVAGLVIGGLILLNGCKKSEQQASTAPAESQHNVAEHTAHEHAATTAEPAKKVTAAAIEQTTCPVMEMKIDKNVFVEYKGKKVYFCCPACIEKFKANPEKYVAKLPQFKP